MQVSSKFLHHLTDDKPLEHRLAAFIGVVCNGTVKNNVTALNVQLAEIFRTSHIIYIYVLYVGAFDDSTKQNITVPGLVVSVPLIVLNFTE